jgi:homoserine kinase type II
MRADMAIFRTLSADDLRTILDAYGQADQYVSHAPIAAGTVNTNVRVTTARGPLFLRVNEGKARADVEREAEIVAHVAVRGVPTPAPLRTRQGEAFVAFGDAFVSLFPWIDGHVVKRPEITPAQAREAGEALAQLHAAGVDYGDHRPGRYEPDEIARRLQRIRAVAAQDPALVDAVALLAPELETLTRERDPSLPLGLIHGDLFMDNVLYADDGHLAALLDFEQASWGRLVYDVAVSVLAFGFGRDDFRADVTRAFLDGYTSRRAPTQEERAGFGAELRFAACRFTVTRITDVHLRRTEGAPAGKDFGRYLQRWRRVQEHLQRRDGLLTLT